MINWLNNLSGPDFMILLITVWFVLLAILIMLESGAVNLYHKLKRGPKRRYNRSHF
jgi:hypothetical protein